jgi:hypothetical protein
MLEWVGGVGLGVFFVLVGAGGAGGDQVAGFLVICVHVVGYIMGLCISYYLLDEASLPICPGTGGERMDWMDGVDGLACILIVMWE